MVFFCLRLENGTMFNSMRTELKGPAKRGALLPARALALWRMGIVLLSMLTLIVMLFATVSHQHTAAVSDDDCIVCNLAFDTLDDVPVPLQMVEMAAVTNFYYLLFWAPPSLVDAFHSVSPPSCGPPPVLA
jgi:hypothetical protein